MKKRKNKFVVVKHFSKICILFIALVVFVLACVPISAKIANAKNNKFVIVIDAGHGGRDGGCVGSSGVLEKDLTLAYAKQLQSICKDFGFDVVMTRKTDDGLYDAFASNKKMDDFQKREAIIKKAKPNLFVSLHINSFSSSSASGANVFHKIDSDQSKVFANKIKDQFISNNINCNSVTKGGDFYLLNTASCPSVLVECGFISNIKEEQLLKTERHKQKLCYSIFCGILSAIAK